MSDILREAPLGQAIRFLTKNKFLKYPEEIEGFQCPNAYRPGAEHLSTIPESGDGEIEKEKEVSPDTSGSEDGDGMAELQNKVTTIRSRDPEMGNVLRNRTVTRSTTLGRTQTQPWAEERFRVEQEEALERPLTLPIIPAKTSDGTILVDWYTTDDPANPQNWSSNKKAFVALQICLYTFAVYSGSAIYTSSIPDVIRIFGVPPWKASLGLALYVLAYGVGPLLFSPLSEIPRYGRNVPYIATFAIFVILTVPTALTPTFAGLCVCRFLQGFFGSPCLATGAATMGDMYSLIKLPYCLVFWVSASYCGPALGPLLSGFAVTAKGWRWSLWEILWISGPVFLLMFALLPETSSENILLRRAVRLRTATGNQNLKSQSEIKQGETKFSAVVWDSLIKPIEISIKDPAVLFTNVYTSIIYGIYYSFFEVFPLVYPPMYGFSIGTLGATFVCIIVACILGIAVYCSYLWFYLEPDILKNGLRVQEHRLKPALYAVFLTPVGLYLFGWTARPSVHWMASVVGITIYAFSVFITLQCIFVYIPLSYPQYAASLFAGNDFCRSAMAFGSILYARPLYLNLGIGPGISLLGGLTVVCVFGMFLLYFFGARLRAKSKFAV